MDISDIERARRTQRVRRHKRVTAMDLRHFDAGKIQRNAAWSVCCLSLLAMHLNAADPHHTARWMLLKQITRK